MFELASIASSIGVSVAMYTNSVGIYPMYTHTHTHTLSHMYVTHLHSHSHTHTHTHPQDPNLFIVELGIGSGNETIK